jgi:hypothetical protein
MMKQTRDGGREGMGEGVTLHYIYYTYSNMAGEGGTVGIDAPDV